MPVPTGTATKWQAIDDPSSEEGGSSVAVYVKEGIGPGSYELLAEQLRMDGVIRSLGPALRAAEEADLETGWFGTTDNDETLLCSEDGWTARGEAVTEAFPCVIARVNTEEL